MRSGTAPDGRHRLADQTAMILRIAAILTDALTGSILRRIFAAELFGAELFGIARRPGATLRSRTGPLC